MAQNKLRLLLLVSGGGTTARAIIEATQTGQLQGIEPACVLYSPGASFPQKARGLGIEVPLYEVNPALPRDEFAEQILEICDRESIGLIGQYGWMPKTPTEVIEAYEGRMINQHPGPLDPGRPDFGGKGMFGRRVHCARLEFLRRAKKPAEEMWTEAIAQRVAVNYDAGAVLKRRVVEVLATDDADTLQQRVLPVEHEVQIETLADFAEGRVQELERDEPLIDTVAGELEILDEAKRVARQRFPQG